MKLSIKDWFVLFVSIIIGGIGVIPKIQSFIGYTLIIIGCIGVIFTLGYNFYRTSIKRQRIQEDEENDAWKLSLKHSELQQELTRIIDMQPKTITEEIGKKKKVEQLTCCVQGASATLSLKTSFGVL